VNECLRDEWAVDVVTCSSWSEHAVHTSEDSIEVQHI